MTFVLGMVSCIQMSEGYGGLFKPILRPMLTFAQFMEIHQELAHEPKEVQLDAYDLYLSTLAESADDWVLG